MKPKIYNKKSFIALILTIIVMNLAAFSYASEDLVPKNEIYGAYRNALNQIGFFNYKGSMIKSPQYDLMWKWDDEVIILRAHGQYGALNYFGTPVVSFKYEFLDEPSNGTIVYGRDVNFEGPKYYGLIDTKGKVIVEAQFESVEKLPNGGIITKMTYPEGIKYGVVFKDKTNFKPAYDEIVAYNEQYVIVKNYMGDQVKYGLISATGLYSHIEYDGAQLTEDGRYVIVCNTIEGINEYRLIDQNDVEVIRQSFGYISPKGFVDNAGNDTYFTTVRSLEAKALSPTMDLLTRVGILQGYKLLKVDYSPILGQHYRVTDDRGMVGLVNSYGEMIIEPRFTSIDASNQKYFVGVNENGRGVFDLKGDSIIDFSNYDRIQLTKDNYIIAQSGKQFNIFDDHAMLQFQFVGEDVTGIGHNRFITKKASPHMDSDGSIKYYYNLVNETGRQRVKKDQYVYMTVIAEDRIALGEDLDGKASYPSGIEFIRAPFADRYGVVNFDGDEILPVSYANMSPYAKGMLFAQVSKDEHFNAYDLEGKKINNVPIASFDYFNPGSVTIAPYENVRRSGYLTLDGSFIELVYQHKVDDVIIDQTLVMEDNLIHVIETKTSLFSQKTIDNLLDEKIIKTYMPLKLRFGGEIYILKDKAWYLDIFSQESLEN